MNLKPLITFAALAVAAAGAMADDITVTHERFIAYKSRAEVRAETAQARADGTLAPVSEADSTPAASTPPTAASTLTREQVRAALRDAPKPRVVSINPAA